MFFSKSRTVEKECLKYFCCNYFVAVILLLVQQWFLSSAAECCSKHLSRWTYNPGHCTQISDFSLQYLSLANLFLQLNVVLVFQSL